MTDLWALTATKCRSPFAIRHSPFVRSFELRNQQRQRRPFTFLQNFR